MQVLCMKITATAEEELVVKATLHQLLERMGHPTQIYNGCVRLNMQCDTGDHEQLTADVLSVLSCVFASISTTAEAALTLTLPSSVLVVSKASGDTCAKTQFGVTKFPVILSTRQHAHTATWSLEGHCLIGATLWASQAGVPDVEYLEVVDPVNPG